MPVPGPAASRLAVSSGIVTLVALVSYGVLYVTMWAPVIFWNNEGWLFLYPIFLVAWLPVAGLSAAGFVLSVVSWRRREARRFLMAASLVVSALLLIASLPALWFGPGPL